MPLLLRVSIRASATSSSVRGEGSGDEAGEGYDGSAGKGPGGSGADSTLGRNMRWVLRFKVTGGRDYLDQLKSMRRGAPLPAAGRHEAVRLLQPRQRYGG